MWGPGSDTDYQPHTYEPFEKGWYESTTIVQMASMIRSRLALGRCPQSKQELAWREWDFENTGKYGRYVDVPLKDAAKMIGLLQMKANQGMMWRFKIRDYNFANLRK